MRNLDTTELTQVAAGGSVESNLGAGLAYVLHGITSEEAQTLGLASPMGWFLGAAVHYGTTH